VVRASVRRVGGKGKRDKGWGGGGGGGGGGRDHQFATSSSHLAVPTVQLPYAA